MNHTELIYTFTQWYQLMVLAYKLYDSIVRLLLIVTLGETAVSLSHPAIGDTLLLWHQYLAVYKDTIVLTKLNITLTFGLLT